MTLNGAPVDPDAIYTVAANSFLAGGGDSLFTFAEGANHRDTGLSDLRTTVDWFDANGTASPDLAQRSRRRAYAPGKQVTLSLSSLAFTGGEAAPGTVEVGLGDAVLGSAEIDASPVDTTDETERAVVSFTVPASAEGTGNCASSYRTPAPC